MELGNGLKGITVEYLVRVTFTVQKRCSIVVTTEIFIYNMRKGLNPSIENFLLKINSGDMRPH